MQVELRGKQSEAFKEKSVNEKLTAQVAEQQKYIDSLKNEVALAKLQSNNGKSDSKVYNRNFGETTTEEQYQATIAGLNKDLKESNRAIDDLKRKCAASAEEVKNLTRTLQRELGEGAGVPTLDQAVSGGWRGRAQQIIMLKAKIKKLESGELGSTCLTAGGGDASTVFPGTVGNSVGGGYTQGGRGGGSTVLDVDRRANEDLQAMSQDRRQIVEALTEERAQMIELNQQLDKKNTAQRARIQNLESETKKLKENLAFVLDKSSTDDELLENYKAELHKLRQQTQQQSSQLQQYKYAGAAGGSTVGGGSTVYSGMTSALNQQPVRTSVSADRDRNVNGNGGALDGSMKRNRLAAAGAISMGGSSSSALNDGIQTKMNNTSQLEASLQAANQTQAVLEETRRGWEAERQTMMAELQRLRRLTKNQTDQLETQDATLRQLKKKLNMDFQS